MVVAGFLPRRRPRRGCMRRLAVLVLDLSVLVLDLFVLFLDLPVLCLKLLACGGGWASDGAVSTTSASRAVVSSARAASGDAECTTR